MMKKIPHTASNVTALEAVILSVEEKGVTFDNYGTIDSNPERVSYKIKALNCSESEFIACFIHANPDEDFCGAKDLIIDLGNSKLCLTQGTVLTVTREEWLNYKVADAKREIASLTKKALKKISLFK